MRDALLIKKKIIEFFQANHAEYSNKHWGHDFVVINFVLLESVVSMRYVVSVTVSFKSTSCL